MAPPPTPAPGRRNGRRHAHPATAALKAAALVLLAAAAAGTTPAARAQSPGSGSALVVGAGLAGLTAAADLCAKGYKVTILEGRARPGGRTNTTRLPVTGAQVELGAGWIHDAAPRRNSVAKLAADLGLATQVDDDEDLSWLVPDAPPSAARLVSDAQAAKWDALAEAFADDVDENSEGWPANQALQKFFDTFVASRSLKGDDLAAVRALAQSELADLEYGATMRQVSARWASEGEQGDGDEKVITKGYGAIVDALLAKIQARASCRNALALGAQVAEIRTVVSPAAARGVYARLRNGTTVSGKFGITTLPLGVLKKGGVKFSPALPADKAGAASKLAMGLLNKVVLVYDRPFFAQPGAGGAESPADASWFKAIVSASDPRPPADGDAFEWWNHAKFWPGSNAIVTLVGADTAAKWEGANPSLPLADRDRLLAQRADALFRQLFPDPKTGSPPVLREWLVTRWAADPFSYGSYSYIPVGASQSLRKVLCAPQSGLLFWAGEHCSVTYPSTANGAIDTGAAAAKAAAAAFPAAGRR